MAGAGPIDRAPALAGGGPRDGGGGPADLSDGVADAADGVDAIAGGGLNRGDLSGDFFGGLCGLAGELLDFGCHHGKASAGFAGTRGLDGGVQRQQISLAGDRADQTKDIADLLACGGKASDLFGCWASLAE